MIGVEMVNGKGTVDKTSNRECSIEPVPGQVMAGIWEQAKDMGLLLGKGGVHGNVSIVEIVPCVYLTLTRWSTNLLMQTKHFAHTFFSFVQVFRIKPPMCIGNEDVDFAISVFRKCLRDNLPKQ
jgi:alanine-glyoxylate transaminase/(R)-3-amino-2-methylpropionate-pyruvate transaminase